MDGGTEGSPQVGGTGSDVAQVIVATELGHGLNVCGSPAQTLEDCSEIGSFLHGDDPELVLFVDPHQEGLAGIVEDTATRRPVPVAATGLQEPISLPISHQHQWEVD